ncbi:carbonic anhydrase 7-like isoform X2 [Anoplophora glabripennis]|uniref:carbonic anhydrase 7-like isoform X2 n=1 Tax=Anoplophora glabripennis TaxID=217634 RepID=UPI0008736DCF|nr:carbonic anhydrase 7-like isoform X2 [Anoplophora glabripennis]
MLSRLQMIRLFAIYLPNEERRNGRECICVYLTEHTYFSNVNKCHIVSMVHIDTFEGMFYLPNIIRSYTNCTPFGLFNKRVLLGPSSWHQKFISAGGQRQSPINLIARGSICIPSETVDPLVFSCEFHVPPCEMKLYNTGHNVVIYATWGSGKRPIIFGGPLTDEYTFLNIKFRWGPNENEGTEHMINGCRYAMELQAAFAKGVAQQNFDIVEAARSGSLLILSYMFMVTPIDNPYVEPIVSALRYIKYPGGCVSIEPIIISLLLPDFSRDYYTYMGSMTFPPCTEGVKWIVKPEPLLISSKQVRKFRKLHGLGGPILMNTRPVQNVNNREIFYYD